LSDSPALFSFRSDAGYPRRVHVGPGLCLLLGVGLGGCASAPTEEKASRLASASFSPRSSFAAEAALLDPDREEPAATPEERAPRARTGNPWADCYRSFHPSDDPAVDLAILTAACAARAGMVAVTPIHLGAQDRDDPPERLLFLAHNKRCYRAFAVGAPSVIDLDIAIKDDQGALLAGDVSRDRWPVVPPRGPLCAPRSERYSIELGVADGRGEYLFQIWGSPEEEEEEEASDSERRAPLRVADGRAD
jgi:hypothetical protein